MSNNLPKIWQPRRIGKCQEIYNPQKTDQEEIENLSRVISRRLIEYVIEKYPTNESPGLDGFKDKLCQT